MFHVKQCCYDKDMYCLQNAFDVLNECKQKQLKIIMLKNNTNLYNKYFNDDEIAICINNVNECIYIVDDYCELHLN